MELRIILIGSCNGLFSSFSFNLFWYYSSTNFLNLFHLRFLMWVITKISRIWSKATFILQSDFTNRTLIFVIFEGDFFFMSKFSKMGCHFNRTGKGLQVGFLKIRVFVKNGAPAHTFWDIFFCTFFGLIPLFSMVVGYRFSYYFLGKGITPAHTSIEKCHLQNLSQSTSKNGEN